MIRERRTYLADAGIVLATIGIAAVVALPNFAAARLSADEDSAIATLRNIYEAQVVIRQLAKIDVDADGRGEFAGLIELTGAGKGRMATPLSPPLLRDTLAHVNFVGEASRIGYRFCIYLPDGEGMGVPEPAGGFTPQLVDANRAEHAWCAYAWPMDYPNSGQKTFFINQEGILLMTEWRNYSGIGKAPTPNAAFKIGQGLSGDLAIGGVGNDGFHWQKVE